MNLEIFNGCMLGDGCLNIHKNGKNASFCYLTSEKEHAEFVCKHFYEYATDRYKNGPVKSEYFDKRTNKTYIRYEFKTKALEIFTKQYNLWYKNNIKVVPNIKLTNLTNLYWYIGDGHLHKKHQSIKLCTNGFDIDSVNYLVSLLSNYKCRIDYSKNKPVLIILRESVKQFLKDIGNIYPTCYKHKWNYRDYKNKKPVFTSIETFEKIKQMHLKENISIYHLSKKFNIAINSIKNFLKKTNDYKPKLNKKPVPLLCSCGENDCKPGYLMCPECIERDND